MCCAKRNHVYSYSLHKCQHQLCWPCDDQFTKDDHHRSDIQHRCSTVFVSKLRQANHSDTSNRWQACCEVHHPTLCCYAGDCPNIFTTSPSRRCSSPSK